MNANGVRIPTCEALQLIPSKSEARDLSSKCPTAQVYDVSHEGASRPTGRIALGLEGAAGASLRSVSAPSPCRWRAGWRAGDSGRGSSKARCASRSSDGFRSSSWPKRWRLPRVTWAATGPAVSPLPSSLAVSPGPGGETLQTGSCRGTTVQLTCGRSGTSSDVSGPSFERHHLRATADAATAPSTSSAIHCDVENGPAAPRRSNL
jgi:hypothetical protein